MSVTGEALRAEIDDTESCLPRHDRSEDMNDDLEHDESVFRVQKQWCGGERCSWKVWSRWIIAGVCATVFVGGLVVLVMYFAGGTTFFGEGTLTCPNPIALTGGESVVCFQTDADKYVLNGADIVAYFSLEKGEKAKQGDLRNPLKTTNHYGRLFAFETEDNKNAFITDPSRFLPQYGGYCAWSLGTRFEFEKSSPHAWSIIDGKLYMNANAEVQVTFSEDPTRFITKSDTYWATLKYDNPPGQL